MPWTQIGTLMRYGYDASTLERGPQMKLTNKSGSNTVKGTIVTSYGASAVDLAFTTNPADIPKAFGVVYEAGVADGSDAWIWMDGAIAKVLLQNSTSATRDYWSKVSDTVAGRADITNLSPPGGTITAIEDHLSEIGHCLESVTAGTDKLALVKLHFN
jgi:hypothetical protein